MLIDHTTTKTYFAYPIFLVGYQDAQFGANVTTCSSSYSLGDMFCFGLGATGHAAAQIQRTGVCTINWLPADALPQLEYAGFHHATAKLAGGQFPHTTSEAGPLLTSAFAALSLRIDSAVTTHGAVNFTATITHRYVQATAIHNGQLDVLTLAPPLFAGDGHQRVYRTLAPGHQALGAFSPDAQ
ncbi:flavin reductase [Lacticaseibacillus absianus]|uniref:flavin reductase n=1 Tax=Lacticaseibacillus absianus TaxID=2729623 RepID=UPI0015CE5814|nr:flavin reductase [Lacticaseibacillus absianus]